ncbi:MAG: hypothetical protein BWZ07_02845 [Alphaproteobacteria bacterium ADurb.BinA280]|jgi:hypothetical protein|nr:hypothetical protein [Xanthomonadales bacterium]MCC6505871.1 hypothetical protein [Aquimonas sp.]OPZ10076.1 MAG: hypothetical protein BWZ07_02845 [Alphaproteobacteria bacterium ADurb.BinA280]
MRNVIPGNAKVLWQRVRRGPAAWGIAAKLVIAIMLCGGLTLAIEPAMDSRLRGSDEPVGHIV